MSLRASSASTLALGAALACSGSAPTPPAPSSSPSALVAATSYQTSEVGRVTLAGGASFQGDADLGGDPVLTSSAGRYFWIARDEDRVIEVDPTTLAAKGSFSTHAGAGAARTTDPYDVAVAPDGSLWIARFDVGTVLVLEPDGTTVRRLVDLSAFDAEDGIPDATSLRILDPTGSATPSMATSKAYVALDVLDPDLNQTSTRPSIVVRLDLETGAVEDHLELRGRDPIGLMVQVGASLYLAEAGDWQASDLASSGAGVERVDAAAFTSTLLIDDAALAGHAVQVAVDGACAVAIVAGAYDAGAPTSLLRFDPATGALGDAAARTVLPATGSFDLNGLAWSAGALLVGDQTKTTGGYPLHVFDRSSTCTLTERSGALLAPLPPVGIVAVP